MRFLLGRTDALGDLVVSLPVMTRILSRLPQAEIHWLVSPYTAPLLACHPDAHGIHLRGADAELEPLMRSLNPDAVLTLSHRDPAITLAAAKHGVPIRVARPRGGRQLLAASHLIWKKRYGTGRHEAQNVLDFLSPFGWDGGWPQPPRLFLNQAERHQGEVDLSEVPHPRVGIIRKGSGAGAFPSREWWDRLDPILRQAEWNPVTLAPAADSSLPETDLRGLMGRIAACDLIISPSTGPAHLAAALGIPLIALMGIRKHHGPDRWAPLGARVQVMQYQGPEADLTGGLDRIPPDSLLPHLLRLQ
jgi:ADP-heptose:LPS heptosyltransferase